MTRKLRAKPRGSLNLRVSSPDENRSRETDQVRITGETIDSEIGLGSFRDEENPLSPQS